MKKRHAVVLFIVACTVLAICLLTAFLFYTSSGTSVVLKGVQRFAPGNIHIDSYSGTLGTTLRLEGLTLKFGDTVINAGSLDLKWRPWQLVAARFVIDDLLLRDTVITGGKKEEDKPVDLTLPRLPRFFTMFYGWIYRARLHNLVYTSSDGGKFTIAQFTGSVILKRGVAYLNIVDLKTDYGSAFGHILVNLVNPGIRTRLTANPQKNTANIDTITFEANLPSAQGNEQVAGPLSITMISGKREMLKLESRLGFEKQRIRLSKARIIKGPEKGIIEGDALMDLSGKTPAFDVAAKITDIDLAPQVPVKTQLSGTIRASGNTDAFTGEFNLANQGESWKEFSLRADLNGTGDRIRLENLNASVFGGTITGQSELTRGPAINVTAQLTGHGINPAKMKQGLEGDLNFTIGGRIEIPEKAPVQGSVKAVMRDSRFQKKDISAEIDASFKDQIIDVAAFNARGSGFKIAASGIVQERLDFRMHIDDASRLIPGTKGDILANGWARWQNDEVAGIVTARGRNISINSTDIASFNADIRMPDGYNGTVFVIITGKNISYGVFRSENLNLSVKGMTSNHTITFSTLYKRFKVEALADGAYSDGTWQGTILRLNGREAVNSSWDLTLQSQITVSRGGFSLSPFIITSASGENLTMSARLDFEPLLGYADARWNRVNLARLDNLFENTHFTGQTTGYTRMQWLRDNRMIITNETNTAGTYTGGSLKNIKAAVTSKIDWDASGLRGSANINVGDRGKITAGVTSRQPAKPALPDQGTFEAKWTDLDIRTLQPLVGNALLIKGYVSGAMDGTFRPDNRFTCTGNTNIADGSFTWRNDQGEITAPVRVAELTWSWQDTLKGNLNISLAQYGNTRADFDIPVAPRLPVRINENTPMHITATGALLERGLLAAFWPGIAQETQGELNFNILARGTFANPLLNGTLNLSKASAYLPAGGLDLKEISANVILDNDRIVVSSLNVRTDTGYMAANAIIQHAAFHIKSFEGTIKGKEFHIVNLPEVNALINPDLVFRGDLKNLYVRGTIDVPQALISEQEKENLIKPSEDVIILGHEEEPERKIPVILDISTEIRLGDKVLVKAYGIDTRLTGAVTIIVTDPKTIQARGLISTMEGKFDAYGVKLNVRRGAISFGGGPVKNANLDILALRRIDDPNAGRILAGVIVTGTPSSPVINLYSQPTMPQMDILSYIVLGRPTGPGGEGDTAILAKAASSLLTGGEISSLQRTLGLDVDIGSPSGGASESVARVGRYLSPKLYVSFGRSIYTGADVFGIRYRLTRNIELETTVGTQNSGAIYYRVEFE
ncbi:MAG: translocation/assembly module TamB domain-containing protein [Syntrophorhabdaceae bacterium]